MSATIALFRKELRQHGPALAGVTALLLATWFMGWAAESKQARLLTMLEVVPQFALFVLPAAALYLGHRLVVLEYYGRTQRFVESLPVRRGHMVLVKAAFGFGWFSLWALAVLVLTSLVARRTEPVPLRFFAIMAARLELYVFALWGIAFVFGFFGRLRVPLALGVAFLLFLLDRTTTFQLARFGPLALVDRATFAFERNRLPWGALGQAAVVAGASVALAYALARVREGSVVESMARRLSARELSALLVMAGGGATLYGALSREPQVPEYRFTTDKVLSGPKGTVEIAYLEDELRPSAERLAALLETRIAEVEQILALPERFPKVRVVHGPEVPAARTRIVVSDERALVIRARLQDLDAEAETQLAFHVLHGLLWQRTRGRAGYEPKHWLLDGFALNVARSGQPAPPAAEPPDVDMLRAVAATRRTPVDAGRLAEYAITSEALGDELVTSLAASGWRVLGSRVASDKTRALARAALSRRGTGDVRDTAHDRRTPMAALFEESTGLSWSAFLDAWQAELVRWRQTEAARRALEPWPRVSLAVRADARQGVGVRGTLAEPLGSPLTCAVKHHRLLPFDGALDSDDLEELGFLWPRGATDLERVVSGIYGRGERAFVALDCDLPALRGPVRLLAERVTVR